MSSDKGLLNNLTLPACIISVLILVLLFTLHAEAATKSEIRSWLLACPDEGCNYKQLIPDMTAPDPIVKAALRAFLVDEDPVVRQRAVSALGLIKDGSHKLMIKLLKDEYREVRVVALQALILGGSPSIKPVGEFMLKEPISSDAKVRAAWVLGEIGLQEAIPYLEEVIVKNREGGFDVQVPIDALCSIGTSSIDALLRIKRLITVGGMAYIKLITCYEKDDLLGIFTDKMNDSSESFAERFETAELIEEIFGTESSLVVLKQFTADLLKDKDVPIKWKTKAKKFHYRLTHPEEWGVKKPIDAGAIHSRYRYRQWSREQDGERVAERRRKIIEEATEAKIAAPGYITGRPGVTITHEIEPMTPLERRRAARLEETRREQRERRRDEHEREIRRLQKRYKRDVRKLDMKDAQLNSSVGWIRDAQGNPVRDETVPTPPPRATGFKRERERLKEQYQRDMQRIREEYEELYPDNWPESSDR